MRSNAKDVKYSFISVVSVSSFLLKDEFLAAILTAVLCISSTVFCGNANAAVSQEDVAHLLSSMQGPTGDVVQPVKGESARVSLKDGYLRILGAPANHYFPVSKEVTGNPTVTAKNFVVERSAEFGIKSKAVDFASKKSKKKDGRSYERFQQTYSRIPVFGAEVVIQLNVSGGVEYVVSDIMRETSTLDDGKVSTVPTISAADAEFLAIGLMAEKHPGLQLDSADAQLMIYEPAVVGNSGPTRLVWQTVVVSVSAPTVNEFILIDAHTGEVALHYTQIMDAMNRKIYDSSNTAADPGTLKRTEGGPATGIADVDNCYDIFGDVYEFYFNEHGRNSIDNAGMIMSATVRYCNPGDPCPWSNAAWDPSLKRMYFGQGFVADDVTAHEMTHGVTQYESNLAYLNESGAINESFSDMWGEWVDLTNGTGNDSPSVRWLCGEDVPGGAIRNMSNPPDFGDPDRKNSPLWYIGTGDNGGVHTNSGVGNKLCYLLTDGAAFNGKTVTGMGISAVAELFYEVQTNLLTSGSDYADLHDALTQAAINLEWSVANRDNLENACLATEISAMLTVNSLGASGVSISSSSGHGGTTNYTKTVTFGTSVYLTAPLSSGGKTFTNWTGSVTSSNPTISFSMTGTKTVTANYATPSYTLTVNSSGASSVIIDSNTGHGGTTNYTKTAITSGTSVNLQAPQYVGSGASRKRFNDWTGSVPSSSQAITFTMDSAKTVTANYESDPDTEIYQISSVADLQALCNTPGNYGQHFILTADLDCSGAALTPIGNSSTPFTGIFDGNGHTISNLTITASTQDYIGLFGYVGSGGQIRNLGVEDVNMTGNICVGGLVGYNDDGTLTGCYATGSVSGIDESSYVGGLVGYNANGTLTSCYATGSVSGGSYSGGLVGENDGSLTSCYATGSVTGTGQDSLVGGLVGYNGGTRTSCYATGSVSGNLCVGGLVGYNYGTLTSCYATGSVSGTDLVGGLVGYNDYGTLTACFWDIQTSGQTIGDGGGTSTGVTGKSTADMKTLSTFTSAGWDFSDTDGNAADWQMPANDYPRLKWEIFSLLQVSNWPDSLTVEKGESLEFTFDLSLKTAGSAVSWTVSADAASTWVSSIAPSSGSSVSPEDITTITVSIDAGSLDVGTYTTVLLMNDGSVTLKKAVSIKVVNHVDMEEFAILGSYWGMTGCNETQFCSEADWFTDGTIDILDLQQLCISWLGEEMIYDAPQSPEITDGFEAGNFSALPWVLTGNANWTIVSTGTYEGTYSAKSGTITHNQASTLEVAIDTADANTISFARKVSSESSCDYLMFYIDGVEKNKWSGTADWAIVTFTFTPGQHTFKWSYTKDYSVNSGSDCVWIDNVRIYYQP
jgi:Zn-dependent metalloprotease